MLCSIARLFATGPQSQKQLPKAMELQPIKECDFQKVSSKRAASPKMAASGSKIYVTMQATKI